MIDTSINISEDISLEQIYEYIDTGDVQEAPEGVVNYLRAMEMVYGMHRRIDKYGSKDAIVKDLRTRCGLSYYRANKLYNNTIEYFYADSDISKQAFRNLISQQIEKTINLAIYLIKDVDDAFKVVKMYKEQYEVLELGKEDQLELPEEMFTKPFKLYTTNAESLGIPKASRTAIAKVIDEKLEGISKVEKDIIRREARLLPLQVLKDIDAREIKK